jgi:hypothetical protein
LAPRSSLQLSATGVRQHHGSHARGHEKRSTQTGHDINDYRNGALRIVRVYDTALQQWDAGLG